MNEKLLLVRKSTNKIYVVLSDDESIQLNAATGFN